MALNVAILQGRLTATPELKSTNNGTSVTSFTLAVNRNYGEETDFINIVAYKDIAEFICKYFTKGKQMLIKGPIRVRKWQDNEGKNRYTTEVIANNVNFCGDKAKDEETAEVMPDLPEEITNDDDLPF